MQRLIEGIHDFQRSYFSRHRQLFEDLSQGQHPTALFITCSDSRINPNLLTQTDPGELFLLRNAGNIVPAYGAVMGGEAATIEYAVSVLKVRDIVICGHSQCGAMAALIANRDEPKPNGAHASNGHGPNGQGSNGSSGKPCLPCVEAWLKHAEATRRIMEENYSHLVDPKALLTAAVEENVLVQLENIRTHPSVAAALSRRALSLHGWVYKFETGQVFAYDPDHGQFLSLSDSTVRRDLQDGQRRGRPAEQMHVF